MSDPVQIMRAIDQATADEARVQELLDSHTGPALAEMAFMAIIDNRPDARLITDAAARAYVDGKLQRIFLTERDLADTDQNRTAAAVWIGELTHTERAQLVLGGRVRR